LQIRRNCRWSSEVFALAGCDCALVLRCTGFDVQGAVGPGSFMLRLSSSDVQECSLRFFNPTRYMH
ncbi:hypothetical protein L9F63_004839, partial [Diploptera punctata]